MPDEIDSFKKQVGILERKLASYEENGPAKLYYALNRKSWEMAEILNDNSLKDIKLDDPKDKTFERIRFIINDSADIATAVKALGETAGITGDEKKDISKKGSFLDKAVG